MVVSLKIPCVIRMNQTGKIRCLGWGKGNGFPIMDYYELILVLALLVILMKLAHKD